MTSRTQGTSLLVAGGSGHNPQQTPRPVEAATIRTAAEVPFGRGCERTLAAVLHERYVRVRESPAGRSPGIAGLAVRSPRIAKSSRATRLG
jgi:hypothetical protein